MNVSFEKTSVNYNLLLNSKLAFRKNTKAKPIFHYTSIGGLQGILSSKTLRFTNIKYMNDKDEIVAGLDSMAKACNASEKERDELRAAFISQGTQTFVCCFSLEDDSLPMWNYYTKEIKKIGLGKKKGQAPQAPRYSSYELISKAKTLDDLWK